MAVDTSSTRHDNVVELPVERPSCEICAHALFDAGGEVFCSLVNEPIWFPEETAPDCEAFERDE